MDGDLRIQSNCLEDHLDFAEADSSRSFLENKKETEDGDLFCGRNTTDSLLEKEMDDLYGSEVSLDLEAFPDFYATDAPTRDRPNLPENVSKGALNTGTSALAQLPPDERQDIDEFEFDDDDDEWNAVFEDAERSFVPDCAPVTSCQPISTPNTNMLKDTRDGAASSVKFAGEGAIQDEGHKPLVVGGVSGPIQGEGSNAHFDDFDDGLDEEELNTLYDAHRISTDHLQVPARDSTSKVLLSSQPMNQISPMDRGWSQAPHAPRLHADEDDIYDNLDDEDLLQADEASSRIVGDTSRLEAGSEAPVSPDLGRTDYTYNNCLKTPTDSKTCGGRTELCPPLSGKNHMILGQRTEPSQLKISPRQSPPSQVSVVIKSSGCVGEPPPSSKRYGISPFVRLPFPKPVSPRSVIHGVSNKTILRVCFRMAEIFKAASSVRVSDTTVMIELYAAVLSSSRSGDVQNFSFADIFFPSRPPFLSGSYSGWKGSWLFEHDTGCFLDTTPERMKMCRAVGNLTRASTGELTLKVLNIWQASWSDVEWVRGIICS